VPEDRVDGLVGRLFAGVGPEERMLDAVRRARGAGLKTGLISNSWGEGLAYDQAMLDELFDSVVISGDVGLHKPDEAIFRLGAERLGVPPEECVFVDDLRENCAGAEAVGMTAILHRWPDSTLPELERLLGI
jgi:epoxide hydrolase-like predicted phosphatase